MAAPANASRVYTLLSSRLSSLLTTHSWGTAATSPPVEEEAKEQAQLPTERRPQLLVDPSPQQGSITGEVPSLEGLLEEDAGSEQADVADEQGGPVVRHEGA